MRKTPLIYIILLVMIFMFSGLFISCNKSEIEPLEPEKTNKESIRFRITWADYSGRGVAIQKIVDIYNQNIDNNYKIELESGDEVLESINSLLKTNESDTVFVLPYRYVKYFGDEELLVDLTKEFESFQSLFYPELWKLGTVNESVYGIPWLGHSICLLYNKSLLDKAGVNPDSIVDLTTLVQAFESVEQNTSAKGIGLVGANHNDISWMVNQFVYGFGSSLVDESGKKVTINNEQAKAAIDFYKNVLGTHAQPSWITDTGVEVMEHFRNQEIAFEFQGVWGVADIDKNGNPFEIGIINLEDIGLYAEVGPMMLSIPNSMSKEKQVAAIEFIEFMISKDAQERIMDGEYSPEHDSFYPFRVPTRMDLADSLVFEKFPNYLPFILGFKRPSIDVPVPKWQVIKDNYYAPGLNQVMKSEISIEAFLTNIETKGNEILKNE